jgi:hypothetical protein
VSSLGGHQALEFFRPVEDYVNLPQGFVGFDHREPLDPDHPILRQLDQAEDLALPEDAN